MNAERRDDVKSSSFWSYVAVIALIVLIISFCLAYYYGVYVSEIGNQANSVATVAFILLVLLAIFGKWLQPSSSATKSDPPEPEAVPKLTTNRIRTAAGSVKMAPG